MTVHNDYWFKIDKSNFLKSDAKSPFIIETRNGGFEQFIYDDDKYGWVGWADRVLGMLGNTKFYIAYPLSFNKKDCDIQEITWKEAYCSISSYFDAKGFYLLRENYHFRLIPVNYK